MADTEKENEGAAKTKGATAPKAGEAKPEAAAPAAKAADNGGAGAVTFSQADLDKAVADAVADRNKAIDQINETHAKELATKVQKAESTGYANGLKDGGDAAVPEGSAVYTQAQLDQLQADAFKNGVQEGLDSFEPDPDDVLEFRGRIMEILMLIPASLRRIRPEDRLNDMVAFLDVLAPMERAIALPMIRSIALMEPNDIPNGKYKADVLNALNVVANGNSLDVVATEDSLDTRKAFDRLQSVIGVNAVPAGADGELEHNGDPSGFGHAGVSSDPNSSHAAGQRLAFLTGGVVQPSLGGSRAVFEDGLQAPE